MFLFSAQAPDGAVDVSEVLGPHQTAGGALSIPDLIAAGTSVINRHEDSDDDYD